MASLTCFSLNLILKGSVVSRLSKSYMQWVDVVKWLASVSPYRSTPAVNKELYPSDSVLPDGSVYLIVGYTG